MLDLCYFVLQCTWKNTQPSTRVLLGNVRPRFRCRKMQIFGASRGRALWTSTRTLPWNYWGACSAPIHQNVLHNNWRSLHVVPTAWHASQTKRQKSMTGGGGRHQSGCLPSSFTLTTPLTNWYSWGVIRSSHRILHSENFTTIRCGYGCIPMRYYPPLVLF